MNKFLLTNLVYKNKKLNFSTMKTLKQIITVALLSLFILVTQNTLAQQTKQIDTSTTDPGYITYPVTPIDGSSLASNVKPSANYVVVSKYSKVAKGDIILIFNEKENLVRITLPGTYKGAPDSILPILDNCKCDKLTGTGLWKCMQNCLGDPVYYY